MRQRQHDEKIIFKNGYQDMFVLLLGEHEKKPRTSEGLSAYELNQESAFISSMQSYKKEEEEEDGIIFLKLQNRELRMAFCAFPAGRICGSFNIPKSLFFGTLKVEDGWKERWEGG